MIVPFRIALAALLLLPLACDENGTSGPPDLPACVEIDPDGCAPLYAPTFDDVFAETLLPRCGVAGGACHGEPGAEGSVSGGLVLTDEDEAHAILLEGEGAGGEAFVRPGDAACSLLLVRLAIDDPDLRMPPGSSALPEGELCSIAQWVEQGAAR